MPSRRAVNLYNGLSLSVAADVEQMLCSLQSVWSPPGKVQPSLWQFAVQSMRGYTPAPPSPPTKPLLGAGAPLVYPGPPITHAYRHRLFFSFYAPAVLRMPIQHAVEVYTSLDLFDAADDECSTSECVSEKLTSVHVYICDPRSLHSPWHRRPCDCKVGPYAVDVGPHAVVL